MKEAKRVYIFETYPSGDADAYDGRTAETLSLDDLKDMQDIITTLMEKCQ